jgi:hypothetical protein
VRHVKGTGAERLMFAFSRNGESLKVYGRKFPVFDSALLAKRRWRAVVETAKPIVYLPFTEDTLDPLFVSGGREYLLSTARKAIEDLRAAQAPSAAYPGELLADVVPAEVIATLAVIEQTDDTEYRRKQTAALDAVLSQYGLKRDEAYRYSVSRAAALGPMQFTNRRGNGTYALVVRRCPAARIDPYFERGATDLLNAMKAAICLFDIELYQMPADNSAGLSRQPESARHLPCGGLQRRASQRREAQPCDPEDATESCRPALAGHATGRQTGGLPLPVDRWAHRNPPGQHPEVQQREPLVRRKVPEHPRLIR